LNLDPGFAPGNATFNGGPGFNMAFGFRDGKDLNPRIGSWKVEYITKKGEKTVSAVEIPLKRCKEVCDKRVDK
jgi:hypothetical protein